MTAVLTRTSLARHASKATAALDLFALAALALAFLLPRPGLSRFVLSTSKEAVQVPEIAVPATATGAVLALVLVGLCVYSHAMAARGRFEKAPAWLLVTFAAVFLLAFLTWSGADARPIPVPGLLIGALALSTPLVFGSLAGVLGERSGVTNVAIEAQLLLGAFSAAFVASVTKQAVLGLLAAMVGGVLVALVLGTFAIRYAVEQVVVGVVLNVLVAGLTNFIFVTVLNANSAAFNAPQRLPQLPVPVLSDIPILGPVLFRQTAVVYLMYVAVIVVWYALLKTRWGLRVRAVGEHPTAADTVGIAVNPTRYRTVAIAGAVAGLGGAYFTLDSVGAFNREMTNGMGFIALAAVIFGQWHPIRATLAALLFGFATNLQSVLGIIGSPVPSEFMLMLPYVVTIFAVAGLVGNSRPPAAVGKPYQK